MLERVLTELGIVQMIEIRQVVARDELGRLIDLADEIARQDGVAIPESLSVVGTDRGTFAIGAFQDGEPIGFATVSAMRPPEVALAVRPESRRRGVAGMLIERVREVLESNGLQETLLVSEQKSISGQAFLKWIGAEYQFSEFRLERSNQATAPDVEQAELVVRQASADDREALIGILAAAFEEEPTETAHLVDEGLAETDRSFALGSVHGEVIGVVRTGSWSGIGDITALAVHPEWQGKGYGRALLVWAVRMLEAAGFERIALEVETDNANALKLYQSCGFEVTNEFTYSMYSLAD